MSTLTTPIETNNAATKTYTLNDLAKIALGAPELKREHLYVLQSLLIILLRKLNCHDETVRIHGLPAVCLQKLLDKTKTNKEYDFQLQTVDCFKEKYELLEKLEQRTENIQAKLEGHFEEIRNCCRTNIFKTELWDQYAAPDEDMCTQYMPENKELCELFRNPILNKELRRRATYPLVIRIKKLETRIEQMEKKLQELTKEMNEVVDKLTIIKRIITDIETIRPSINKSNETFREAMQETQEMLNCKLERIALPALKKYLQQRFQLVIEHIKILKEEARRCETWGPLTVKESTCLSCARVDKLQYLYYCKRFREINEKKKCFCSNYIKVHTILEKIDTLEIPPYIMRVKYPSTRQSKQSPNTSELPKEEFDIQKPKENNTTMRNTSQKPKPNEFSKPKGMEVTRHERSK